MKKTIFVLLAIAMLSTSVFAVITTKYYFGQHATIFSASCSDGAIGVTIHGHSWTTDFSPSCLGPGGDCGFLLNVELFYQNGTKRTWLAGYPDGWNRPLPINTKIPVIVINKPDQNEFDALGTIFVNPSDYSLQEFKTISACIQKNESKIGKALLDGQIIINPQLKMLDQSPAKIGGLAYIDSHHLYNATYPLLINNKSFSNGESLDQPFTIGEWGTILQGPEQRGNIFNPDSYAYLFQGGYDTYKDSKGETIGDYVKDLHAKVQNYAGEDSI